MDRNIAALRSSDNVKFPLNQPSNPTRPRIFQRSFHRVPSDLPSDLSPMALKVYIERSRMADNQTHQCRPKMATLARILNCHSKTIERADAELEERSLVSFRRTGRAKICTFLEVPSKRAESAPSTPVDVEPEQTSMSDHIPLVLDSLKYKPKPKPAPDPTPAPETQEQLRSQWERWVVIAPLFPSITAEKFWRIDRHFLPQLEADAARKVERRRAAEHRARSAPVEPHRGTWRNRRSEAEERMAADIRTINYHPPKTPAEAEVEEKKQTVVWIRHLIGLATGPAKVRVEMLQRGECTQAQIAEGVRLAEMERMGVEFSWKTI